MYKDMDFKNNFCAKYEGKYAEGFMFIKFHQMSEI